MGKTISPGLDSPEFPVLLHLWVRTCEIPPFRVSMSIVLVLCRSCLGSHIVDVSWVKLPCHFEEIQSPRLDLPGAERPG